MRYARTCGEPEEVSATGSSLLRGWRRWVVAWLAVFACAGCATIIIQTGSTPVSGNDPYEDWNRVFAFNEALDEAVLKPLATIWVEVLRNRCAPASETSMPTFADAWSSVNNLLQGKPVEAFQVAFRFGVNTVFGFASVLDLASEMASTATTRTSGRRSRCGASTRGRS